MAEKEYLLFCDESDRDGAYFSEFYGGVLVGASHYERISDSLNSKKSHLNVHGEVKWDKVAAAYLTKYMTLISAFFEEVRADNLKVRIMFRHNARVPKNLTTDQVETTYFRLYYQFIKHAFGFQFMPQVERPRYLRLLFDEFPDKREHAEQFKGFTFGLQELDQFKSAGLRIRIRDIAEVRSHHHVLLQCLDLVLGAISFRLNDKHKAKPAGSSRRGNRTIAKEKLYNHILGEIRKWKSSFNVGITTGVDGDVANRWEHPYRHWAFTPSDHQYDEAKTKRKRSLK